MALSNLEKVISRYRELRNLQIHRGEVPYLADLTDSNFYDFLKIVSFGHAEGMVPFDKRMLVAAYRGETKEIVAAFDKEIFAAMAAVAKLFDELLPVYNRNERILHLAPSKNCGRLANRDVQ